jgi:small-conductance mechanosensitive channel
MNDFFLHKIEVATELLRSNSLTDWLIADGVAIAVWCVLWSLRRFTASRYKKYSAAQHRLPIRLMTYLIAHTKQFFLIAMALYAAQSSLNLPDRFEHVVSDIVMILILLQVGLWAKRAVTFYLDTKQLERGADQVFNGSIDIINFVSRALIWSLLILVALSNLGVNITALLAGLGVGGVAVALALQSILGDLFASLSIALDKPFVVGDRLVIDTFIGNVEHIGIKTTRLRSETGEQIVLSNADILKSRVRNFGRVAELRVLAAVRVSYETPSEKLREIPKLLESIVREQPNTRFERSHFKTLGDAALHFELSYFVQQPSVNPLMDLQQTINFRIVDEIRRLGVEFDDTTQRVVLKQPRAAADH